MNMTLVDVLKGKKHKPPANMYLCDDCGREWFTNDYPIAMGCMCWRVVDAQINPEYVEHLALTGRKE